MRRKKTPQRRKKTQRSAASAPMSDILTGIFTSLPVHRRWLDKEVVKRIERDDQVIASMGSRKAATLKKELVITCAVRNEEVPLGYKEGNIKEILENALSRNFLNQLLDTPLQGMSVFELNWIESPSGLYAPLIVERNYRDFVIKESQLRYDPIGSGVGERITANKAIYALFNPKHDKEMGTALYDALYWPVKLKGVSLSFWHKFLEKYGVPWAVGKTSGDKDEMAKELFNMLSGDAAVIEEDDAIETISNTRVGDFDKMVSYCDTQITKVILGGNLTSEVKTGSFAAAQTHNEIRTDIAMSDEHIVIKALNDVVTIFKEVNALTLDISIELKDADDPNYQLAERDEKIANMGYTPTQEYIEKTYNIQVNPLSNQHALKARAPFSLSNRAKLDEIDRNLLKLSTREIEQEFMQELEETLTGIEDFDEAIEALTELYPDMKTASLEGLLEKWMINADLLGSAEVEDET